MVEAHNIIQSKMRPWIVKKIIEYLGEEEKTLTEFILTKLGQRAPPQVRFFLCAGEFFSLFIAASSARTFRSMPTNVAVVRRA